MIDLNYTYIKVNNILGDILLIKDFDYIGYIIMGSLILVWIINIIYILPVLYSIKETYISNKEKSSKKLLLKQIIMQKELEDEILKEIKKH